MLILDPHKHRHTLKKVIQNIKQKSMRINKHGNKICSGFAKRNLTEIKYFFLTLKSLGKVE